MPKQRNNLVTPRGRAVFPHLHAPDTKFDADGVYRVKLSIPTAQAEELISKLDAAAAASIAAAKKEIEADPKLKAKLKGKPMKEADLPYGINPENEDETLINFKMKAQFTSKKTNEVVKMSPAIFDSKGKPLPKGTRIGGGSILRVSFEPVPFFTVAVGAGISLRLNAVQVIELREFGGASFGGSGFEAEEGFSADDVEEKPETAESSEKASETTTDSSGTSDSDGSDF